MKALLILGEERLRDEGVAITAARCVAAMASRSKAGAVWLRASA